MRILEQLSIEAKLIESMRPYLVLAIFMLMLATSSALPARSDGGGFLFVTFQNEKTPMSEQVYFGLSQDGRYWVALNQSQPVLVNDLGSRGVRDPFIFRSHDGKKTYILGTDGSSFHHPDWSTAARNGNRSIVIWESADLVHWSAPRLAAVAPVNAGCTWAPEAIFDASTNDYLVFWASTTEDDHFTKHRIWACRTKDFISFSQPFIYIDRSRPVIDTDIVWSGDKYYRFSKDEEKKTITMEVSDKLMGEWAHVPRFSLATMAGYEGPECFLLRPAIDDQPPIWCLILDCYSHGTGYHPYVTSDLAGGQFSPASDFSFPFQFRHGAVLAVTAAEYQLLRDTYEK